MGRIGRRLSSSLAALALAAGIAGIAPAVAGAAALPHYDCGSVSISYPHNRPPMLIGSSCTGPIGTSSTGTVTHTATGITRSVCQVSAFRASDGSVALFAVAFC